MNHSQTLKRAWNILWSYRALWIFGLLLAITSASGSSSNVNFSFSGDDFGNRQWLTPPAELTRELNRLGESFEALFTPEKFSTLLWIIAGLVSFGLLVFVLFRIANYVSKVALVQMVDRLEATGEKLTWKQGLRLGWSRSAWRLFLIDLVIYLPLVLAVIVLFGLAALPVLSSALSGQEPGWTSVIATIGLFFSMMFLVMLVGLALSLVMALIQRACVQGNLGVTASIRQGAHLVRQHFMDVFLMWLLLVGVSIAFFLVILPIAMLVLGVAALLGGGAGWLTYTLLHTGASELGPILWAVVAGTGVFGILITLPLAFLGGLREVYLSTAWTLTYRELDAMAVTSPKPADGNKVLPTTESSPA